MDTTALEKTAEPNPVQMQSSVMILGAVIAGIAVLILCGVTVLPILYISRKKRKVKYTYSVKSKPHKHLKGDTSVTRGRDISGRIVATAEKVEKNALPDAVTSGEEIEMKEKGKLETDLQDFAEEDFDESYFEDPSSFAFGSSAIPVAQFPDHVKEICQEANRRLEVEYMAMDRLPQPPCTVAQLPHNLPHNRFTNIFPYDGTRVHLKQIADVKGSDYINASFVDGYGGKKKAYIAAQGPVEESVEQFWRMVWEYQLTTIVMLTRCVEDGRGKCLQYWPEELQDSDIIGDRFEVTLSSSLPFAEYEIKKITVQDLSEPAKGHLTVTQFHYTAWPDHGVPSNAMSLINFIHRVRKQHPASLDQPLLVHCSAGVGRTGTFILLDVMMQQMKAEDTLSVYQFVRHMRTQRMKMVQTQDQYVFIHQALSELVVCGETEVAAESLKNMITHLQNEKQDGLTGFQKHFQTLQELSFQHQVRCTEAEAEHNRNKNRFLDKLPSDSSCVWLRPGLKPGSDYINASFVNGYKQRNAYIATQGPLENTVVDFWRMIWKFQCGCIVMLCELEENGREASYCYWPGEVGAADVYGNLTVELKAVTSHGDIVLRRMEVVEEKHGQTEPTKILSVTQLQLISWPEQGLPHPMAILSLTDHLTSAQMSSSTKHTVVMCRDGVGRTGTFICIHSQLERLKTEGVADIFQTIKSARMQRPGVVPNAAHYAFCYEVLNTYVENFNTSSNFKEVV